ncbi:tRNA (adenosine(37)-N6)-dimethylallyltransferase MiaA [Mucilaginibacter sp.]|jgi:tRNA dimethylallyltransferase|uniref:tRNA (adenosine(37)-N6)-dimethylallyltransferase MiaA n=1 Tax=Mucilaginibacter sp. TaxID=1882438 RepID=UPI002C7CF245|nr:tRNA (adenosine(37)-N6)-dimethylallyltransferase MiaA [Mucilaginibacter sp.]HTI60654.1 tRNA (adenosine(37)-N6)-dimethylallyltransferase MiaA [Mucilaginibacter sp.]
MSTLKTLLIILGPTASGKTALAIDLAKRLNTEIISADSRQFYREMSIGTAKPTAEELDHATHHFVNSHSIKQNFSVGDFEKQGLELLETIFKTHNTAIMVGGSGLYIRAISEGFDELPSASPELRNKLNKEFEEKGLAYLQDRLKETDPVYYQMVDLNNPQRMIRALEVFESTGLPFSSYHKSAAHERPFRCIKIGIDFPRELLYQRINQRVDDMVKQGLVDEVKTLLPYRHLNALNTVGYSELFDYFDGKTDLETAISLIKQNTRRFAKRQLTWFRKDQDIKWIPAGSVAMVENALKGLSEV